jgi:hypothetical protein
MTTPTITLYPDTLPAKGQANAAFDVNTDDFLTWLTLTNGPELAAMITYTDNVAATVLANALAGNLPPLTGKAGNYLRANAAEDGGEFRTPAEVLSDIGAPTAASVALKAPLASPALTGTPTVPTATVGTNTTQAASTAFVLANAPASPVKALVYFDASSGSPVIQGSTNVASITDLGSGRFRINFTTAMSSVNYVVAAMVNGYNNNQANVSINMRHTGSVPQSGSSSKLVGSFEMLCGDGGNLRDCVDINIVVME